MAAQAKLTTTLGLPRLKDVTVAAGTAIAGSDAMELNIDYTKMTKGDALKLLDQFRQKIFASKWPLL